MGRHHLRARPAFIISRFYIRLAALLADAFRRLTRADISLEGASDHGVSEALYLSDPDGNGIELYWDRPRELWPRDANGQIEMFTRRLDLGNLLSEL